MKCTLCVSIHRQVLHDSQYVLHHNGIYHVFSSGQWKVPIITGNRPPPCVDFTINTLPDNKSVMFGGFTIDTTGYCRVNDLFLLSFSQTTIVSDEYYLSCILYSSNPLVSFYQNTTHHMYF